MPATPNTIIFFAQPPNLIKWILDQIKTSEETKDEKNIKRMMEDKNEKSTMMHPKIY